MLNQTINKSSLRFLCLFFCQHACLPWEWTHSIESLDALTKGFRKVALSRNEKLKATVKMAGPYHGYQGWEETSGISMTSEAARSVCGKEVLWRMCVLHLWWARVTRDQTFIKKCDILSNMILAEPSVEWALWENLLIAKLLKVSAVIPSASLNCFRWKGRKKAKKNDTEYTLNYRGFFWFVWGFILFSLFFLIVE